MTTLKTGDTARISATLLVGDVVTEPNTLRLDVSTPGGTVTSYVWGTNAEIVHDGVGQFHFDLYLTSAGTWLYEWYSNHSLTAFKAGTIVTAVDYPIATQDDQETPARVANCAVTVTDYNGNTVATTQTDSTGSGTVTLDVGTYTFAASKNGWVFPPVQVDLGGVASTVTVQGYFDETWLKLADLETVVHKSQIDRLFQDDGSGMRDGSLLQSVIREAEALAESKLLRGWDLAGIRNLAFHDPAVRMQAAWIALELATERRGEFVATDGKGRFWAQYERAVAFFDALGKSKDSSRGAKAQRRMGRDPAGVGANSGSKRLPAEQAPKVWVFADESDGTKHGGF